MATGIIYFIQPAELLGTQRYKVGMSAKPTMERIKSYKIGTRYLCIMECSDPLRTEKEIKGIFNKKFKLIAGSEYFEGDENEMISEFLNGVAKCKETQENIKTDIVHVNKNIYIDDIICKDILIYNGAKINNIDYERLNDFFINLRYKICEFDEISVKHNEKITKQFFEEQIKYHEESLSEHEIKYLLLYENEIINIFNDIYDEYFYNINEILDYISPVSFCRFLGKCDENFSYLTTTHIKQFITKLRTKIKYILVKEANSKYTGVLKVNNCPIYEPKKSQDGNVHFYTDFPCDIRRKSEIADHYSKILKNDGVMFVSNVEFDYNHENTKCFYLNFDNINENKYVKILFESWIWMNESNIFDNLSKFTVCNDEKIRKIIYPLIIQHSLNDHIDKNDLTSFIDIKKHDAMIKHNKKKYKNIINLLTNI